MRINSSCSGLFVKSTGLGFLKAVRFLDDFIDDVLQREINLENMVIISGSITYSDYSARNY